MCCICCFNLPTLNKIYLILYKRTKNYNSFSFFISHHMHNISYNIYSQYSNKFNHFFLHKYITSFCFQPFLHDINKTVFIFFLIVDILKCCVKYFYNVCQWCKVGHHLPILVKMIIVLQDFSLIEFWI